MSRADSSDSDSSDAVGSIGSTVGTVVGSNVGSKAQRRTGRFRSTHRLLDSRDYRRVLKQGRRRGGRDLVVIVAPKHDRSKKPIETDSLGTGLGSRLGITASRKVGNAVCRNRFKRRIRAWFRERRGELGRDIDLVVIARKSAGQLGLAELDERLSDLLGLEGTRG